MQLEARHCDGYDHRTSCRRICRKQFWKQSRWKSLNPARVITKVVTERKKLLIIEAVKKSQGQLYRRGKVVRPPSKLPPPSGAKSNLKDQLKD
jgi:hypothetical protein